MNSKKQSQNKKILSEESVKNKTLPFAYQHRYNCYFSSKHGSGDIEYVMHCDYKDPRSSKATNELKRRLSWTYAGCRLERFRVISSKKVCSGYLYQNKRSNHEVK